MDTGDDDRVRKWPCCVGLADGKPIVRLTAYTGSLPSPT
ncbi:hypothetical protein PC116_g33022 [Phytophthora cactorum]|nr:hypothetical protein PC116_g33022 [Phytophthora cactorum]